LEAAICIVLDALGDLSLTEENREEMVSHKALIPLIAGFVWQTSNLSYQFLVFKLFTEFTWSPMGRYKMHQHKIAEYYCEYGLVDAMVAFWIAGPSKAEPLVFKIECHMLMFTYRAICNFLKIEPSRSALLRMGIQAKIAKLKKGTKNKQAANTLELLDTVIENGVIIQDEYDPLPAVAPPQLICCSNCRKPNQRTFKCSACKMTQYCGR